MGRLNEVAQMIGQHKAADRVIAQAKVTGVPAADWLAERAGAASKGKSKTAGKPKKTTGAKGASPKTRTKKKTGGSRKK